VSSTIGKDQPPPGLDQGVAASRKQAEQQANAVDRDQRATRFRASLTKPDPVAGERAAKTREGGQPAPSAAKGSDKPEASSGGPGTAGDKGERLDSDRGMGLGLTGEQALAIESALGGVGGAGGAGPKGGRGGGGAELGLDDLSLGGAGGPGRASASLGKTPGEEAIIDVAAAVSAAAAPVQGQAWARPEGPQQRESRARELPQPLPGVDPIHQLYIGRGPGGAEARMMITVGPLAGTEIQLREGPGGVQATITTQNASTRQTLVTAMAAVSERLKAKGQKLDVSFDGRPPEQGASGHFAQQRQGK
jgi:hypothetical protein